MGTGYKGEESRLLSEQGISTKEICSKTALETRAEVRAVEVGTRVALPTIETGIGIVILAGALAGY